MKRTLTASAIIVGTFLGVGIASASLTGQGVPTPGANGTVPVASSTATGGIAWTATSSLGISGGSSSSGAPFNSTSTATNTIAVLNTTFNIPANYATAGCPWNTSITDLGACVNAAYNSASTTASSTIINIPILPAFTTYTTGINFNNDNEFADLECAPGQILEYAGSAGTPAITYNESDANAANIKVPHLGGENCTFAGGTTTNVNAISTGILIGGTNGEAPLSLINFGAIYFGTGWKTATNTFMLSLYSPVADGNVTNWITATSSNSGEALTLYSPKFLDDASTTNPYCFDLQQNGASEFVVYGGSMDDCPAYVGPGNTTVTFDSVNWENPAAAGNLNYPSYPYLTVASTSQYTNVTVQGGSFNNDAHSSTSTPQSFIVDGASLTLNGAAFNKFGTTTVTNAVDYSVNGTTGQLVAFNNTEPSAAFTYFASSTTATYPLVPYFDSAGATFASGSNTYGAVTIGSTTYPWTGNMEQWEGNGDTTGYVNQYGGAYFNALSGGATSYLNGNIAGNTASPSNAGSDAFNAVGNVLIGLLAGNATSGVNLQVESSTLFGTSAATPGCVEFYEQGATSTKAYGYINTTPALVVTTTKPSFCQ